MLKSAKDKETILRGKWYWDSSILSLKNWTSLFDPMIKRVGIQPLWVKFGVVVGKGSHHDR